MPRTRHIYVYDALDNPYGFSVSVPPEIDCTTFHSFYQWNVWNKNNRFFLIFKSWQVFDWLGKWIIMLGFMDLRWPRVFDVPTLVLFDKFPVMVSCWNLQEFLPVTDVTSMQKVKVKGQGTRGHDPNSSFPDHNWSLNSNMSMKLCTNFMTLRKGALLFFKVIRQISSSHG